MFDCRDRKSSESGATRGRKQMRFDVIWWLGVIPTLEESAFVFMGDRDLAVGKCVHVLGVLSIRASGRSQIVQQEGL